VRATEQFISLIESHRMGVRLSSPIWFLPTARFPNAAAGGEI